VNTKWPFRKKEQPGGGSEGLPSWSDCKRLFYGANILSRYEKYVIIEWRELYIKVGGMAKENMDGRRWTAEDGKRKQCCRLLV